MITTPIPPSKLRLALPNASRAFLVANGLMAMPAAAIGAPALRQRAAKKMSRLQADFLARLHLLHPSPQIVLSEAITIELANGCRYTPDCFVLQGAQPVGFPEILWRLSAYEVKGSMFWDDARVKVKVAARSYPWISFYLARRPAKGAAWAIDRILP